MSNRGGTGADLHRRSCIGLVYRYGFKDYRNRCEEYECDNSFFVAHFQAPFCLRFMGGWLDPVGGVLLRPADTCIINPTAAKCQEKFLRINK